MKYLIASDIHGSAEFCRKMLLIADKEGVDKILLVGDLLYHGPRNPFPKQYDTKTVYEWLNERKDCFVCVRGNCDSEVDQMVLDFPMMDDYKTLPLGERTLYLTHGHLHDPEKPFATLKDGDLVVNGHFHVPTFKRLDNGLLYANCGSVGLPKDGSPHSCIIATEDELRWVNIVEGTVFHTQRL